MDTSDDCLFCRFTTGDLAPDVVAESELSLAFRDINPQAPTHVLVIPRRHVPNAVALARADAGEIADLFDLAGKVADAEGLGGHYRTVFNTGSGAQQTVFHAHLHVLGGREFTWPPG
ncbi:HIT domain-containing protein [Millisia brevis]|uniref:HIT domain-containing protein n=1 Tax=Millisia brevis TaxID=264148 RepID=UPI001C3F4A58|nr:HIT domain-containing protein [Millisia brevis]